MLVCLLLFSWSEVIRSATDCPHLREGLLKWSLEETWTANNMQVPSNMSTVTINNGMHVLLDVENPPRLSGIEIMPGGSLTWDLKPIQLNVGHILVMGQMIIGNDSCRFDQNTVITLEDETTTPAGGVGQKVIGILEGGELLMYGKVYSPVWTRIAKTATKGSNSIELIESVEWRVGDKIVIAPTGYDMNEAEENVIKSISTDNKTITLTNPLKYEHFGVSPDSNDGFEERAEVGVLNRYIRVEGNMNSEKNGFGGHTMVMDMYKKADFVGVEFTRCGQRDVLARYPIHYHVVETGANSMVKDNSIHYNYQRCITLHSVSYLPVLNNLCYDVEGHGIFIEDGYDVGAVMDHNLVIKVNPGTLQPHDKYASSGFFLTNPNNTFTNNQVSGAIGNGFWFAPPMELIGPSHDKYDPTDPSRTILGKFENNKVRTVKQNGLFVDLGPDMENHPVVPGYDPRQNPNDPKSTPVAALFSKFQATKVSQVGVYTRGGYHVIQDAMIGSAFAGVRFANAPGAIARQTMSGGLITRVTKNSPADLPHKGTDYESEPVRGIIGNGGPNSFSGVKFQGFTLPNGACIASMGTEQMSPRNSYKDLVCDGGQTLLYANTGTKVTDNEKMFAALQIQGTSIQEIVVNNDFMRASASKCEKKSDSILNCKSGTHVQLAIEDLSYADTAYPSSLKPADPHATVYRLNAANKYSVKSKITVTGYSNTFITSTGKTTMYPLIVPLEDSSDSYGIAFQHQTPTRTRVSLDSATKGSMTIVHMCYHPKSSSIKAIQTEGKPMTAAASESELSQGNKYWYDIKNGILSFPIVSLRDDVTATAGNTSTIVIIDAEVTSSDPFNCFSGLEFQQSSNDANMIVSWRSSLIISVVVVISTMVAFFTH